MPPPVWSCFIFGLVLLVFRALFESYAIAPYLGMLSIPCVLYVLWRWVPAHPWPEWLVGNAFGIFLIHKFVLLVLRQKMIFGDGVVGYILTFSLTFVASLGCTLLLRKMLPRISSLLLGGR